MSISSVRGSLDVSVSDDQLHKVLQQVVGKRGSIGRARPVTV